MERQLFFNSRVSDVFKYNTQARPSAASQRHFRENEIRHDATTCSTDHKHDGAPGKYGTTTDFEFYSLDCYILSLMTEIERTETDDQQMENTSL